MEGIIAAVSPPPSSSSTVQTYRFDLKSLSPVKIGDFSLYALPIADIKENDVALLDVELNSPDVIEEFDNSQNVELLNTWSIFSSFEPTCNEDLGITLYFPVDEEIPSDLTSFYIKVVVIKE